MFFLPNHVQIPAKSDSPRHFSLLCSVVAFLLLPLLPVFWLHPKLKAALCVVELPSDQLQHIPTLQASAPWTLQENLPENREIDKRQTLGDKEK